MVVDFHTHVGKSKFWIPRMVEEIRRVNPTFVDSMETLMTPENLVCFFKKQGVDFAVCIADHSELTGYVPNDFLLDFCKGHGELIAFCSVNPHDPNIIQSALPYISQDQVGGFKFFPTYQYFYPNDRKLYPFYELLESARKIVMFHTGTSTFPGAKTLYGDPIYVEEVAVDFPKLKVVMAHSGRPFWYEKAFYLSRLHNNLYMDMAGIPPEQWMEHFPRLESKVEKVLFGSDFPALPKPVRTLIESIQRLPLSAESISKILGGNAQQLLGL